MVGQAPELSIVVFSRDDADQLERCLESVAASPGQARLEWIVVDNASSDQTPALLESWSKAAPWPLRSLRLPRDSSFSSGNNLGLSDARAETVLFLNPDTRPTGPLLDGCLAQLASDPLAGLLSPRLRYPDGSPQPTGWHLPSPGQLVAERLRLATRWVAPAGTELSEVGWLMGCFLLGPTAFLRSLGGFDEDFWFHGTDLEICARVHAAGRRVLRWEGELLVHVGHRDWPADRVRKSRAALAQFLRRDHGWSASTAVSVLTASLRASLR